MGRLYLINLEGRIYSCKHCQTDFALCEDIVSKLGILNRHPWHDMFGNRRSALLRILNQLLWGSAILYPEECRSTIPEHVMSGVSIKYATWSFHCKHGKAYLFSKVVNVNVGEKEERMMITGMHTVADIFCIGCGSIVGWKYEAAYEKGQKYKEGKFILERYKVSGPDGSHYWANHEAQIDGSDADDA